MEILTKDQIVEFKVKTQDDLEEVRRLQLLRKSLHEQYKEKDKEVDCAKKVTEYLQMSGWLRRRCARQR